MQSCELHKGIVEEIDGNFLKISIDTEAGCDACKISGSCMSAGRKSFNVKVRTTSPHRYVCGQRVTIEGKKSSYYLAVLLCYVVPLLLLVVVIAALMSFTELSDVLIAGLSLFVLADYYFVLYLLRKLITQKVEFQLKEN